MKKPTIYTLTLGAILSLGGIAYADDIQFVTLPQVVQTSVIREARIPDGSNITRVVRDESGVYAVTVRRDTGEQVLHVTGTGEIVQTGGTATTTTTTTTQRPVTERPQVVVTYDEVQKSQSRYQLVEKKGNKEVYLDNQTGEKVTVKRDND